MNISIVIQAKWDDRLECEILDDNELYLNCKEDSDHNECHMYMTEQQAKQLRDFLNEHYPC